MIRIIGIDPGSRVTGYGVIELRNGRIHYLTSGAIRASGAAFPDRLREIFEGIGGIVETFSPIELAIEKVFVQRNVDSALKLGQARGAAICAAVMHSLSVYEYSPNQIKQAVVGRGHAAKEQVQHMVKILLSLSEIPQSDEADALACALCHTQIRTTLDRIGVSPHARQTGVRR